MNNNEVVLPNLIDVYIEQYNVQQGIQHQSGEAIMQNGNIVEQVVMPMNFHGNLLDKIQNDLHNPEINARQDHNVAEQIENEYDLTYTIPFDQIKIGKEKFIIPEPTHIRGTPNVEIPEESYQQPLLQVLPHEQFRDHV